MYRYFAINIEVAYNVETFRARYLTFRFVYVYGLVRAYGSCHVIMMMFVCVWFQVDVGSHGHCRL